MRPVEGGLGPEPAEEPVPEDARGAGEGPPDHGAEVAEALVEEEERGRLRHEGALEDFEEGDLCGV